MRRAMRRFSLILTAAVLVGALNVVPAFAQGAYPSSGYGGGMSAGAPAPAAGAGASAPAPMVGASSAHSAPSGMSMFSAGSGSSVLYMVQAGDTLDRIAARFGVSPLLLLLTNPSIMNANRIFVGQFLVIPSQFIGRSSGDGDHDADDLGTSVYTVRFGDTLARIARRLGVSEGALLQANPGIVNPNLIFAGQTLVIPGVASSSSSTTGSPSASASGSASGASAGAYGAPTAPQASSPAPMPAMPPMTAPAQAPGPPATPAPTQAPMQAPPATSAPGAQMTTVNLTAHNLMFDMSTITVLAGAHVTVNFNNQDAGVPHTFSVYTDSSAQQAIFKGQAVTGPATITYTFTAPSQPGTYFFRCDVHPTMMTGQFVVR